MCHGRGTGYTWGSWTSGGLWVSVQVTDMGANIHFTNLKCKMSYRLLRYPIVRTKLEFLAHSVSNSILRHVLINSILTQPDELDTSGYSYFMGRNQDPGSFKVLVPGPQLVSGRTWF